MLMMRLQRVGRKNDPAYRIVVTDKRTGVKSDKHVDRIGSYNPKLSTIILDKDKAKEWLVNGVQPSVTMHNILVSQGVIDAKKINPLPKKSPIVDEAAIKKAEEEAAAKVEADKAAAEAIALACKLAQEAAAKAAKARAAEAAAQAAKARTEVAQAADLAASTYATELNKRALGPPSAAVLTLFAEIVDAQLGKVLPSNTLENAPAPGSQRLTFQSLSSVSEPTEPTQNEAAALASSTTIPTSVSAVVTELQTTSAQESSETAQMNAVSLNSSSSATEVAASADGDMARLREMLLEKK